MSGFDGHTIDVGYVHVLTEHGGPCVDNCPHPDHALPAVDALPGTEEP